SRRRESIRNTRNRNTKNYKIIRLLSSVPGRIELLTGSESQLLKDTLKRRVYGRDRGKNRFSVTGSARDHAGETNTLLSVKRSGKSRQVSQLFGECPRDARRAIKEEKAVQLQK